MSRSLTPEKSVPSIASIVPPVSAGLSPRRAFITSSSDRVPDGRSSLPKTENGRKTIPRPGLGAHRNLSTTIVEALKKPLSEVGMKGLLANTAIHGLIGWGLCGAVMAVGMKLWSLHSALIDQAESGR